LAQPGASTETPAATTDTGTADPPVAPEATPGAPPAVAPTGDAPAADQATSFEAPFRLEDVPEEHRQYVEHYIARTRPEVTRAFQEAAEVRRAAEQALAHVDALNSPDTAFEVLRDTLDEYGIDLTEDIWAAAQASQGAGPAGTADELQPSDPAIQFLVERAQREDQEREAQAEAAQATRDREHVQTHLATLAAARGYGEAATDVPEEISNGVAAFAAVLPYSTDGTPNLSAAQEMVEAIEAKAVQDYLARKRPDPVPEGGGAGDRRADLTDPKQRFALATEIADRAMAAHQ
jgi:hypothetical protein